MVVGSNPARVEKCYFHYSYSYYLERENQQPNSLLTRRVYTINTTLVHVRELYIDKKLI